MKITIDGDDGVQRTFDGSEVMLIDLASRPKEIVALEEVLRILRPLSVEECRRILTFALDAIEEKARGTR